MERLDNVFYRAEIIKLIETSFSGPSRDIRR